MDIGMLLLRVVVGLLFVGHGTQKLFGWFGGSRIAGTSGFLDSLGFPAPRFFANVNGATEAGAGVLLALGLLSPLAAAAIVGVMLVASLTVHAGKGVWNTNGGYELPLVMAAAGTAVAFVGPGAFSIDALLGWNLFGPAWGLTSIGVGIATGLGSCRCGPSLEPQRRSRRSPRGSVAPRCTEEGWRATDGPPPRRSIREKTTQKPFPT